MKIEKLDNGKIDPKAEKFIKVVINKNRLEITCENVSPSQMMQIAKSLAEAAMKLSNVHS
jgi:hypothetical protein